MDNRIEEALNKAIEQDPTIKFLFYDEQTDVQDNIKLHIVYNLIRHICQLFPQPLDDKDLREKNIKAEIVNAYHTWRKHCGKLDHPKRIKEFTHSELYEQTASYFADQILTPLQQKIEEAVIQARKEQMVIDWAQAGKDVEEAKKEERERIIKSLNILNQKGFSITEALIAMEDSISEQALKGVE